MYSKASFIMTAGQCQYAVTNASAAECDLVMARQVSYELRLHTKLNLLQT